MPNASVITAAVRDRIAYDVKYGRELRAKTVYENDSIRLTDDETGTDYVMSREDLYVLENAAESAGTTTGEERLTCRTCAAWNVAGHDSWPKGATIEAIDLRVVESLRIHRYKSLMAELAADALYGSAA